MPLEKANGASLYAGAVPAFVEESISMSLESLRVLEGRVEDVLGRQASLVAERDRLQEQLKEAQARLAELSGRLETYEKERAQVRARVESILGRLEGLDLS
jgi:chromosome segregation ATPase